MRSYDSKTYGAGRLVAMLAAAGLLVPALGSSQAEAFCGFLVGSYTSDPLNSDRSQAVITRNGNQTTLSLYVNYRGPADDFSMVLPMPVVLEEGSVTEIDKQAFADLEAYSAPRLAAYYGKDACNWGCWDEDSDGLADTDGDSAEGGGPSLPPTGPAAGVTIESQFVTGNYEITILSATESFALMAWLESMDYAVPEGGAPVIQEYIAAGMYFMAVRVVLDGGPSVGAYLPPLQINYESEDFGLPVRLGTINADGVQDLIVYTLTDGITKVSNYEMHTIPTDILVGEIAEVYFTQFYDAVLDAMLELLGDGKRTIAHEYVWQAQTKCDPCTGPPAPPALWQTFGAGTGTNWVLTRIRARYTSDGMPEDLQFETEPMVNQWQQRQQVRWVRFHPAPGGVCMDQGCGTTDYCCNNNAYSNGVCESVTGACVSLDPECAVYTDPMTMVAEGGSPVGPGNQKFEAICGEETIVSEEEPLDSTWPPTPEATGDGEAGAGGGDPNGKPWPGGGSASSDGGSAAAGGSDVAGEQAGCAGGGSPSAPIAAIIGILVLMGWRRRCLAA